VTSAAPIDPTAGAPADPGAGRAGRDALVTWAIVLALVAVLVRINVTLPAIGHVGSALVAVLFLYAPVVVGGRRGEDLGVDGFHAAPLGRGLAIAGTSIAVIFPLFALGYFAFYEIACHSALLAHLVPHGLCSRYGGLPALRLPPPSWQLAEFAAVQLVVVALPEELFFRGFLLRLLERRFPPRRRWLGGGVGWALVLSAAAFAVIHLPKDGDPRALATFVPGLLFGWMRSATGSILASTVTHASSNVLIRILELMVLR
jgi:membrane protease YdiL (CAAX protease family)